MASKNVEDQSIKDKLIENIDPLNDSIKEMELLQLNTEKEIKRQMIDSNISDNV